MNPHDDIHIVFNIDDGYAQHLAVLIKSLESNHKTSSKLCFHILDCGISTKNLALLRSSVSGELVLYKIDLKALEGLPIFFHYSLSIYSRLLIGTVIPQNINKIIYLDADTVVLNDIQGLWDQSFDTEGVVLKAVIEPSVYGQWFKKKFKLNKYLNSGVMLIDLDQWRAKKIGDLCIEFIKSYQPKIICHDQDALNVILKGSWQEMDPSWNFMSPYYFLKPIPQDETINIVHFVGSDKPWQYVSMDPCRELYSQYLKLTAWKDFTCSDKTPFNILKRFLILNTPRSIIFWLQPFVFPLRSFFTKKFLRIGPVRTNNDSTYKKWGVLVQFILSM